MSEMFERFSQKAAPLSMHVSEAASWAEALACAVGVCVAKPACENLLPAPGEAPGAVLNERTLAAPGLPEAWLALLQDFCATAGIRCVTGQLREHTAGLDVGVTLALCAVVETATCVVESRDEDVRLATMLCEHSVLLVPASRLVQSLDDTLPLLQEGFGTGTMKRADYLAFITGSSRTSDIERVLTLGVHGPLELHVIVWNDAEEAA